jgi:hypothetical protein
VTTGFVKATAAVFGTVSRDPVVNASGFALTYPMIIATPHTDVSTRFMTKPSDLVLCNGCTPT